MMAPVTHSYIWNRNAAKTLFASLTKIKRQEIILSIEYSIIFIVVFVDKLQNQESCIRTDSALTTRGRGDVYWICVYVCMYVALPSQSRYLTIIYSVANQL